MGFIKNISYKRAIKSIAKITDEEQLTKIAITENKNVQAAYQAVTQIKSQENLVLIARIRMGKMPPSKDGNYYDRFGANIFFENLNIAQRAIMKITDIEIVKALAKSSPPSMKTFMSGILSDFPETCADLALSEYSYGTSQCCAYAQKVNRPDLVRKVFCKTSHGSVAIIAADKMSDIELMDTLLSDAQYLASRNISGGKYDACHITKYIVDRFNRVEDLQKLAESAVNEKLRDLAKSRLNRL